MKRQKNCFMAVSQTGFRFYKVWAHLPGGRWVSHFMYYKTFRQLAIQKKITQHSPQPSLQKTPLIWINTYLLGVDAPTGGKSSGSSRFIFESTNDRELHPLSCCPFGDFLRARGDDLQYDTWAEVAGEGVFSGNKLPRTEFFCPWNWEYSFLPGVTSLGGFLGTEQGFLGDATVCRDVRWQDVLSRR